MTAPAGLPTLQLQALRGTAARDPQAAVQTAARQFESLFMQELMKSMRASTLASGMLDNGGTQLGTDMLDQQFAQKLSGLPGGLSDQIARQLARQMGAAPGEAGVASAASLAPGAAEPAGRGLPKRPGSLSRQALSPAAVQAGGAAAGFVARHRPAAEAASRETGIPADFILAQAAHESGWGRREIRMADGSSSHNVFGIKAGPGWTGKTATVTTTEYVDGVPRKLKQTFRAYDSYAEAYTDHARLLSQSPRYARVVAEGGSAQGFAENLQKAGYATDPAYAHKLGRVIDTTLRLARSLRG